jgi:hypothetical protein
MKCETLTGQWHMPMFSAKSTNLRMRESWFLRGKSNCYYQKKREWIAGKQGQCLQNKQSQQMRGSSCYMDLGSNPKSIIISRMGDPTKLSKSNEKLPGNPAW